VDVLLPHRHGERLGPEACSLALRAGDVAHELLDLLPAVLGVRLGVAALQVGDDPVEPGHILAPSPVAVTVGDVDPASVRPEEDDLLVLLRQLAPRLIQVYPVLLGERLQDAAVVLRLRVGPRHYGAFVDA
jgi:hypothetical protein